MLYWQYIYWISPVYNMSHGMRSVIAFLNTIEATPLRLSAWLGAFFSLVLIRTFIENFSGRSDNEIIAIKFEQILHYATFYLLTLLGFMIIVHYFTRKPMAVLGRLGVVGVSAILIAPLVDLVVSGGDGGVPMMYLFVSGEALWQNYVTWYGAQAVPGATLGIRLELIVIHLGLLWYVWFHTKRWLRALLATLLAYTWLFFLGAFPSFFLLVNQSESFLNYFLDGRMVHFLNAALFYPNVSYLPLVVQYDTFFEVFMLQHLYLLLVLLIVWAALLWRTSVVQTILGNLRPERVGYYLGIAGVGIFASLMLTGSLPSLAWINVVSILCLALTILCAWLYVVGVNDLADRKSDAISNPTRPLVSGAITVREQREINLVFLGLTLVGAYSLGQLIFFFMMTYLALAHAYSNPPLHLKRWPIINPFVMSLAALTIMLAGFFLVHPTQMLTAFPTDWLLGVVLFFFLITNIKDIKDYDGDRAVQVYTLPVLLGERVGVHVIAAATMVAILLVPLWLGGITVWLYSIIAMPIIYYFIVRRPYHEQYIFITFFVYFSLVGVSVWNEFITLI